MVTELLNLRNGQSPVSVRQSVTIISARDASASEKEGCDACPQTYESVKLGQEF